MRPILEQFVVRREVAVVEDGTELFEKILIADGLGTFEHRQMDEDELRAMGFRLARDFFSEKVIFAAVEPGEQARDQGSRDRLPRLSEEGRAGNRVLHVDQLAVSDEARAVVGSVSRVMRGIEFFCEAEQTGEEVGAEELEFADWQIGEIVKVATKERLRREDDRPRRGAAARAR
jgi:hypothetical protein